MATVNHEIYTYIKRYGILSQKSHFAHLQGNVVYRFYKAIELPLVMILLHTINTSHN